MNIENCESMVLEINTAIYQQPIDEVVHVLRATVETMAVLHFEDEMEMLFKILPPTFRG